MPDLYVPRRLSLSRIYPIIYALCYSCIRPGVYHDRAGLLTGSLFKQSVCHPVCPLIWVKTKNSFLGTVF
jgi:hypothetical protein